MADATTSKDIESLRAEVSRLTKIVTAQGAQAFSDVRHSAANVVDAATPAARRAAEVAKAEGSAIAQSAREHPAATGSVLLLATAIGVGIGYLLGAASQPEPPRRRYW
ncbi:MULTISPECIES: hypothetical protein [unclassified Rhizobium]|uniref:hypothetical protein n=1 Tax=unclassified Rhizobium TaxID=2613769 RepID=UPI000712DAFA|nr:MULTISPECIES: hypothetical protein [unclassified Rhizobium]KQT01793.1 hypothetical protein ASG50_19075 [Rhizobium sp. Leaf386]KQT03249.1 hypothetical protein ASG42_24910 [Rhizobium sp. Leaf391]KQU08342.1 hypothetical protein ASG68_22375 [Rhizobium sp. Leaf453]